MQKSKDLLFRLESIVKNNGVINFEVIDYLNSIFSGKSERVLEVIKRGIRKKIIKSTGKTLWIAKGEDSNHLIYPKLYCSCQDFYKNVVAKQKKPFCKHILAQVISEALNDYKTDYCEEKDIDNLIEESQLKF
jgi:predicted nucleic acid-binding Zn finger protein